MITPRLIARTHYQVSEPSIVAFVVRHCTSPIQSDFHDSVSLKLARSNLNINPAAARYAVDLTKSLGLLQDNLVWTDLGHLLNIVYLRHSESTSTELTDIQKFFFLRIFLEFDGAAFVFFAKKLAYDGSLPKKDEQWASVAQDLFSDTYAAYLGLASEPEDRTRIRHLAEQRTSRPFRGKSGPHQCFVHLDCLYRLGLVTRKSGKGRVYAPRVIDGTASSETSRLLSLISNVSELERAVTEARLYDIVGATYECIQNRGELDFHWFETTIRRVYDEVTSTGVSLCSLRTLVEAIQIESLVLGYTPPNSHHVLRQLRLMQRSQPRHIRFHVDVFGRPAFVKIS